MPTRPPLLFPVLTPTGAVYDPSIAYPYIEPIFSSLVTALICALVPLPVFLFFHLSFADGAAGILGLLYSLSFGTLFQIVLKKGIGGLRPHFLSVCAPDPLNHIGEGFQGIMSRVEDVCRGDAKQIDWALQSFPSGHSEIAFAGLGYLAIYLFTHLYCLPGPVSRRFEFARMSLVIAPILFATYISSTLVLCRHHHAFDCIFGAAIGCLTAVLGYQTAFCSLFDHRTNWKPRSGKRLANELEKDARPEQQQLDEVAQMDGVSDVELKYDDWAEGRWLWRWRE